jgi:hypothetical protein
LAAVSDALPGVCGNVPGAVTPAPDVVAPAPDAALLAPELAASALGEAAAGVPAEPAEFAAGPGTVPSLLGRAAGAVWVEACGTGPAADGGLLPEGGIAPPPESAWDLTAFLRAGLALPASLNAAAKSWLFVRLDCESAVDPLYCSASLLGCALKTGCVAFIALK